MTEVVPLMARDTTREGLAFGFFATRGWIDYWGKGMDAGSGPGLQHPQSMASCVIAGFVAALRQQTRKHALPRLKPAACGLFVVIAGLIRNLYDLPLATTALV